MQKNLQFNYEARYFTLGTPGEVAWLVCHGYGQLASYFIKNFQVLADLGHYVVAPEGLSRFYMEGFSGRVGASWMTKEERLTDIQNYLNYLDAVAEDSRIAAASQLNLLGFSQGVATVCRWAMHTPVAYQKLVLWAGVFPPDVSPELCSSRLKQVDVFQVWGNQDPYLNKETLSKQTSYLEELHPKSLQQLSFEGEHKLHAESLLKLATGA